MAPKRTPMMEQYCRIRNTLPEDTILFFRLGDFFEMFFDDALEAAPIMDIALTKRNNIPMCGVPWHNVTTYLTKLVTAGKKVAICDQVEDAATAKGIVKREVTRIITSGTILEENILDANRNNYLCGLAVSGESFGVAVLDISTGTFWVERANNTDDAAGLLAKIAPSECIVPESLRHSDQITSLIRPDSDIMLTPCEDWTFEHDTARDFLTRHFKIHSLCGFGCENCEAEICAAGAILHYVSKELRREVGHIKTLQTKSSESYMLLDETTVANLELMRGNATSAPSLIKVFGAAQTPMGGRMMREWMLRPLIRLDEINARHDAVDAFHMNRALLKDVRKILGEISDIERIIARLGAGSGNARDLRNVTQSLKQIAPLKKMLADNPVQLLAQIERAMLPQADLVRRVDETLVDEPPVTIKDGGVIRKNHHRELDELRESAAKGREWLASFQVDEQTRTGIKSLKIRHNKIFGYYIEVSKANIPNVPDNYTRKQTLVNAERFITPELKEYENRILGAQDRAIELEYKLFTEIRAAVVEKTADIQKTARAIAALDALTTFADRALHLRYSRPTMNNGDKISIVNGRHPVIEQIPKAPSFVPNDTLLDGVKNQLIIITGPNMAGKSTYIRQVALIVIMAQMGSFVPATEAEIGVVDRVFTRVGASDDLARGRSTFMVEMQETANILNNATNKSLIILDEIGRGTSTFDGISIAWAVAEYLHDTPHIKAKTLFATHYHELTELALTMDGVKNYNILVKEQGDKIAFLRRIAPGSADKSYGIHVGQLAGLPQEVVKRANEILANLEDNELADSGMPTLAKHRTKRKKPDEKQLILL